MYALNITLRIERLEKELEARKPIPVRVLAIPPGCTNPVWLSVDETITLGADVQKVTGNDLPEIKRVLDYMAGPGCAIE